MDESNCSNCDRLAREASTLNFRIADLEKALNDIYEVTAVVDKKDAENLITDIYYMAEHALDKNDTK